MVPSGLRTYAVQQDAQASKVLAHGGAQALSARMEVAILQGVFKAHRWLCGYTPATGTLEFFDLRNRRLSAWLYVAGDASNDGVTGWCRMTARGNAGQLLGPTPADTVVTPGRWVQLQASIATPVAADRATTLEITCEFEPTPYTTTAWAGTLFIDDVVIQ